MIVRHIFDPLYRVAVTVISKCTPAQANKHIREKAGIDANIDKRDYANYWEVEEGKRYLIYFRKKDPFTIAHEAGHLLDDIYAYRNIEHKCSCAPCSEHRAHQHEGWMRLLKEALR